MPIPTKLTQTQLHKSQDHLPTSGQQLRTSHTKLAMAKRLAVALLLLALLASTDAGATAGAGAGAGGGVGEMKAPVAGLPVPDLPLLPPITGTVTAPVVPGIPPVRKSTAANKSP
ncbi:uncharacterized protein LOC123427815 [Hordeum vulgare subsp. vulgare]|uniref:uncharacterized protein LOC123427815 n=1 Tax=Hordeum vulgare subsp. vulgare TaxID=112509 RepID=UPI00162CC841|nr:uncharacterized protein LOC123427815 [Hordeum vulgare subsp. vulgare]